MKKFITILIFVAILCTSIVFIGCGNDTGKQVSQKTFSELVSEITGQEVASPEDAPYYFEIGKDDSYCMIDTNPMDIDDFSAAPAMNYIKDMNEKLGLPDYLYNDMIHTSYSQGKQEETFGNIKVRYYYHPDKGLNVTYYRIG